MWKYINVIISFNLLSILPSYVIGDNNIGNQNLINLDMPMYFESHTLITTYQPQILKEAITKEICFNLNTTIKAQNAACNDNLNYIKSNIDFGFFNPDSIINSVNAYKIDYTTSGVNNERLVVSGAILIPDLPAKQIKGVVLFYHGTEAVKSNVPSNFFGNSSAYYGQDLSAIYASQGYIVVAPDYIGLGDSSQVMHPYIDFPEINVASGKDMLNATYGLLKDLNIAILPPIKLYITGYSEGGNYAMWSAKLFQQKPLENFILKKTAPISGAYDLLNAQLPFEFANTNRESNIYNISSPLTTYLFKPVLIAYTLSSFGHYLYNDQFTRLMQENFFNLVNINPINDRNYNAFTLINSEEQPDNNIIISSLSKQASFGINPFSGNKYSLYSDSVYAFVESNLDNNRQFVDRMKEKSIVSWTTLSPIRIIYLSRDSLVTNLNSLNAYKGIKESSNSSLISVLPVDNVNFIIFNPITNNLTETDHTEAMQILSIAALNFFNEP
jgi:hypothetical protein